MPTTPTPPRRDVVKAAGVITAAAAIAELQGTPAILKVRAASDQMKYGVIGTGGRGGYLLKHLTKNDNGHFAAIFHLDHSPLGKAPAPIRTHPTKYKGYPQILPHKKSQARLNPLPRF